MANENLDNLKAQVELQEKSLASEQRKQEIMQAGGIHYKTRRSHAEELLKLEDKIQETKQKILEIEEDTAEAAGEHAKQMKTLSLLGGGLLTVMNQVQDAIKTGSDNTRATATALGITVNEAKKLNLEFLETIKSTGLTETTLSESVAAAASLKDAFGGSVKFTSQQAVDLSIMANKLNISTDQAANFSKLMFATSGASLDVSMNLTAAIKALSDESAVKFSSVMKDIANSGDTIASTFGLSADQIGIMAVAVRKMGFELQDVVNINNNLLDIENSIEKQMKFNLLTGRNINLDKARALAIEGDHEAMLREVVSQAGNLDNLNQLEIKALNDALGIDILKLKNAQQLLANKQADAKEAERIAGIEEQIRQGQLEEFKAKAKEREEAKTANEATEAIQENLLNLLIAQGESQADAKNLALIMQGIQLVISGAMAAQSISSAMKAATEERSNRAAGKAVPKLVAGAVASTAGAVAKTIGSFVASLGPLGLVAGLAGAAGLIALIAKAKSKSAEKVGDLAIDPNGGPVVMSPNEGGLFQGTKNDGLSMGPGFGTDGGSGGAVNIEPLIKKMDQLIAAVNQARVLNVDGYQLNEAIHLEKVPAGL